jgi:3-deoxy-D-manno-octulosonate 8-phosphate phosphatase (KDO 8-P phosphatase)
MIEKTALLQKARQIKLVIFDVDGVLTGGQLYFDAHGEALKIFCVQDGMGMKLLQQSGVKIAIISSRQSAIVAQRMSELGIEHVYQGRHDKRAALAELLAQLSYTLEQVAYVGDDLPDLPLIRRVGLGIAVANARPLLLQQAAWQTTAAGGNGAAREVCELIMAAQGTLEKAHAGYL